MSILLGPADGEHFMIPAYCYMPDHVHFLLEGTQDDSDLKRFIKAAKQNSGFYFEQRTGERLWNGTDSSEVLKRKRRPST